MGSRICHPVETFTSTHLAKHTKLLSQGQTHKCAICAQRIDLVAESTDTMSLYLCPGETCTTFAHLKCIAHHFLNSSSTSFELIPRGGSCPGCKEYVLWGDVIKGCYRRSVGKYGVEKQAEEEEEETDVMDESDTDERSGAETEVRRTPKRVKVCLFTQLDFGIC